MRVCHSGRPGSNIFVGPGDRRKPRGQGGRWQRFEHDVPVRLAELHPFELLTALSDSDEDVRYFAADALGDVRTGAVRQAIETRLAVETSPVVRSALMTARNKLERVPER